MKEKIIEFAGLCKRLALELGIFDFDEGLLACHRGVISNPYFSKVFADHMIRIIVSTNSEEILIERTKVNVPMLWQEENEYKALSFDFSGIEDLDKHVRLLLTISPEIKGRKNDGKTSGNI